MYPRENRSEVEVARERRPSRENIWGTPKGVDGMSRASRDPLLPCDDWP